MQKLRIISINSFFSLFIVLFFATTATAQNLDESTVQKLITSKRFVFKAQSALPMGQVSRQLTPEYEVKLSGDSIVAYLPYFGRAYSATYGERGGIDFTSTKFDYKIKQRKKGGWDVTIKPANTKDIQELSFFISESGSATLIVTSNNRQPISFNGYIVQRK